MIKLFESYNEIAAICKKYGIENWSINSEGLVDVDGDVNLVNKDLLELPLKFGRVNGNFHCNGNNLKSLSGSPKWVGGIFDCYYNLLTSLEGGPKEVSGHFDCGNNHLTSLIGAPEVGNNFLCSYNNLTSLEGAPKEVGGYFACRDNSKLKCLSGLPIADGGYIGIEFKGLDSNQLRILAKEQEDYGMWDREGNLIEFRFGEFKKDCL